MSTLAIHCLGPLDIRLDDRPLAGFETQKARGLLVYLACHAGQPLSRAHLASLLWGESAPDHASRSLRQALVNLRRILPANVLCADRETVTFNPPAGFFLDVAVFAADPAAAELYRGDFLQGFDMRAAPQWEEWLMAQREAHQAHALAALEALAARHAARGEYGAATACWQRALAIDPWRESAHQGLMRVYLLSDQRSAALTQYQRCQAALQAGLGVAPLPETEALHERIRDGTDADATDLPPAATVFQLPFTGRGELHAQLMAAWQAAGRGGPRLLLVAGEAGLGKTRLIEEALRQIASYGVVVARGRCLEFGAEIPYRPVIEALRALLEANGEMLHVRPTWLAELSHLLPELSERFGGVAPSLAPDTARQRIFDAITYFLCACAGKSHVRSGRGAGLILFLDDLHWADQSTLDLLNHLLHAARQTAGDWWIIGAYRPEETALAHPLTRLRLGVTHEDLARQMTLTPLTGPAVAEVAAWLSADEAQTASLAAHLQCQSEGNPFILSEIVRDLQESGVLQPAAGRWRLVGALRSPCVSERVADVTLGRVARLPGSAQRLLNFAAVIGEPFTADLLTVIVPDAAPYLATSLAVWEAVGLVRSDPAGRLEFAHDRIRAAIYGGLTSDMRKLLHERIGQALLDCHAPVVPDDVAAQVAYHFERSLAPRRAAPYLAQAAEAAGRVYAHAAAADYYQRLLPLTAAAARPAVLLKLGQEQQHLREFGAAEAAYRDALACASAFRDHRAELAAWLQLTDLQIWRGEYTLALESATHATAAAHQAGDRAGAARAACLAGSAHFWTGHLRQAWALGAQALRAVAALQPAAAREEAASLRLLSMAGRQLGHFAPAQDYATRLLDLERAAGDRDGECTALNILGEIARLRGDFATAIGFYEQALVICRGLRIPILEGNFLSNCGGAQVGLGDYAGAEARLVAALALPALRDWPGLAETYRFLAGAYLGQGRLNEARPAAETALALSQQMGLTAMLAAAWRVLGCCGLTATDCAPRACFAQSLRLAQAAGMAGEHGWTLRAWAAYEQKCNAAPRGAALQLAAQAAFARLGMMWPQQEDMYV